MLFIQVHIVETCHTFGLSLLVFRILPSIDNVTGLFLLNGVCIIPAFLNLFSSHHNHNQLLKILTYLTDIASIFMQLSVFFIPYIVKTTEQTSTDLRWQLPLTVFLISIGYWESFAELNFSKWFQHNIKLLRKTRPKVYVTASLLKIFILVISAVYFLPKTINRNLYLQILQQVPIGDKFHRELGLFDEYDDLFRVTSEVYIPFFVQIISSCLCYYTGRIACKVRQ